MQINYGFVCNVPKTFPFTNIKNYKLSLTVSCSDLQFSYDNNLNSTDSCLVLNPPENLTNLFNQKQSYLIIIPEIVNIKK